MSKSVLKEDGSRIESYYSKPFVSVIVPTYHDWDRLGLCLQALLKQSYLRNSFEVIVVNNDLGDIPPKLNLPPNFKLICEEKRGSYAARNAGIRVSKGEILAFTDSDCIPGEHWISHGVKALESGAFRIGGKIELFYQDAKLSAAEVYEKAFAFQQFAYVQEYSSAATANMMTHRYVFDVVGMFNESMFSGGDFEWGLRSQNLGFDILYCPEVLVFHPARKTLSEIIKKKRRTYGGAFLFSKKNKIAKIIFSILIEIAPPFVVGKKLLKNRELSMGERVVALSVHSILKIVSVFELFQLLFGKKTKNC